ncbi:protein lethal(2)essential for life-like [Agrilus planipennis]|uniref:Protein lethal(2)essential for life-like n=1 Tax=Agrilus planipennis TaxID=224129 RepID=A0A1W4WMB9_AGRPL|nr:protein lethal(2)essential for life-like [Agrilus planipennis]
MSILPLLLSDPFDVRPSRILDQHFGLGLDPEDLLAPLTLPLGTRLVHRSPAGYYRPWRSQAANADSGSIVTTDKDKFQVNLDVQHFKPDEIKVTATGDNTITIEGKHEEKQDDHGYISRHFVRRYVLPEGHDLNQVVSNLSSDGVLSITAPKKSQEGKEERAIPIQQTGQPSKPIENKGTGDK